MIAVCSCWSLTWFQLVSAGIQVQHCIDLSIYIMFSVWYFCAFHGNLGWVSAITNSFPGTYFAFAVMLKCISLIRRHCPDAGIGWLWSVCNMNDFNNLTRDLADVEVISSFFNLCIASLQLLAFSICRQLVVVWLHVVVGWLHPVHSYLHLLIPLWVSLSRRTQVLETLSPWSLVVRLAPHNHIVFAFRKSVKGLSTVDSSWRNWHR